jgi:acetyltransferase-like isoleucine patch superfamily enzyme
VISHIRNWLLVLWRPIHSWILQLRFPRVSFGSDTRIGRWVVLRPHLGPKRGFIRVGRGCEIQVGARLETWGGSIQLSENTFVGPYVVIYGHGGVRVGRGCLISMHCRILSSNHTIPPVGIAIRSMPDVTQPTVIEDDVWLGAGATVLAGVRLHQGAIIGAGAVVTQDIPANAIAVGVPARVIRYRPAANTAVAGQ